MRRDDQKVVFAGLGKFSNFHTGEHKKIGYRNLDRTSNPHHQASSKTDMLGSKHSRAVHAIKTCAGTWGP